MPVCAILILIGTSNSIRYSFHRYLRLYLIKGPTPKKILLIEVDFMIKSNNFDINNQAITIDRLKDRGPIDPNRVPWDQKICLIFFHFR